MKVTFHFLDNLEHQSKAIQSTVDLFDGIPKRHKGVYAQSDQYMFEPRNPRITAGTRLLQNLRQLQLRNEIFTDDTLQAQSFGVEMETGTGKTYVYLRTILTLYETYGFKKFMIVVPSVAIRAGVRKTLEQLQEHFKSLHNVDIAKHSFIYDSGRLGRLKAFVENHDLDICVINSQAFASEVTRIQSEQEQGGEILWEKIRDIHPILIIDEPQKIEGTGKKPSRSRQQLTALEPLFELKYSATHRQEFPLHMIYSLDSFAAYEQELVKRIRVRTVYGQIEKREPYLRYVRFNKDATACVELFHQPQGGKAKPRKYNVDSTSDLHELSGSLPQYRGYRLAQTPHKGRSLVISTPQGEIEIAEGSSNCEHSQEAASRIQIRLAIENHFDKQFELLDAGLDIKALTLFFVDQVKKVRDDDQPDGRGEYLRVFDEEYTRYLQREEVREKLKTYSYLLTAPDNVESVREGYFARDKKKAIAEVEYNQAGTAVLKKSQDDIDRGIELILERKDELISFKEPLAFIFSHSALREGWDNPNVFTLCTLRHSSSEIAKKQEIGRGLRLPVDIHGNRIGNATVNVLTVIANDHYDHFAETLQQDFNEEMGFNAEEVTQTVLQNTLVQAGLPPQKITPELVNALRNEMTRKGVMNANNTLKRDMDLDAIHFAHEILEEHAIGIKKAFSALMEEKGSRRIEIENGDDDPIENGECSYVSEAAFKGMLDQLTQYLAQRSIYQFDLNPDVFIYECIEAINDHFANQSLEAEVTIETGSLGFQEKTGKARVVQEELRETVTVAVTDPLARKTDLQVVDHIMYHTFLPRLAILEIVRGITKRDLLNSQDRLEEVTRMIDARLRSAKAKSVHAYEIIQGYEIERSRILEAEPIDQQRFAEQVDALRQVRNEAERTRVRKRAYATSPVAKKAVHKYYNVDSNGEYDFAAELERDPQVRLFSKLRKGRFVIDTPYSDYSPDWAIVYRGKDEQLKLYFVVETKIDKDWDDLSDPEQSKIRCGKLHFQAVSQDIKFDWVKNYPDFKSKFAKSSS